MRVAYCIICHKYNPILEECIEILKKYDDIYIHVDKKSDLSIFEKFYDFENIFFLEKRIDVRWGHFSQIKVMLNLLQETRRKQYDYIFFLSGDCLPLKNPKYIHAFLSSNYGKEFVGVGNSESEAIRRVKYQYSNRYFNKNKSFIDKILIEFQKVFRLYKINPAFNSMPKLYKGCNWLGITSSLRDYILQYLEENPWYEEGFKNSVCGDEVFFHTIICNSEYVKNIYSINQSKKDTEMALRYIDWSIPYNKYIDFSPILRKVYNWMMKINLPKLLIEEDLERMIKDDLIFGRKFSHSLNLEYYREKLKIQK